MCGAITSNHNNYLSIWYLLYRWPCFCFQPVVDFFFDHLLVFGILRVEASQKIKCRGGNGPPLSLFSGRWR